MENMLVILIVVLAGVYLVRTIYRSVKKDLSCGCGGSSCDVEATCIGPEKEES